MPSDPTTSLLALNDRGQLEYIHNAGMRFWNSYTGNSVIGAGGEDRWWSVEELGEGASVVRSKSDGREKEVWVLQEACAKKKNTYLRLGGKFVLATK